MRCLFLHTANTIKVKNVSTYFRNLSFHTYPPRENITWCGLQVNNLSICIKIIKTHLLFGSELSILGVHLEEHIRDVNTYKWHDQMTFPKFVFIIWNHVKTLMFLIILFSIIMSYLVMWTSEWSFYFLKKAQFFSASLFGNGLDRTLADYAGLVPRKRTREEHEFWNPRICTEMWDSISNTL